MRYEANDIVSLSQGAAYRTKIGMYLSADRQEAINLGLRELIVNVQDEYEVYKPSAPYVQITLDTKQRIITVEDNMRGIPVGIRDDGMNSLTAAMLIAHSGGKHSEGAYVSSIGLNGTGSKVVCHTAKWLRVEVRRDGNLYTQDFQSDDEGAVPMTEVLVKKGNNKTGTKITYQPDPAVYGDIFVDVEVLRNMLREMSYFTRGLNIVLIIDGKEEKFFSENGLLDGLDPKGRIGSPIHFLWSEADCQVELALQWTKGAAAIRGYANGLYMPDGGAFITGFKTTLTRVFNRLANSSFSGDQIRSMLDGYVSVKVRVGQFSNQSKTALANTEARTATSSAILNALEAFYAQNAAMFAQVVEILTRVDKADIAAQKARDAVLNHVRAQTETAKKKVFLAEKLKDSREHGENSVLIITEGDSALGGLASARDVNHIALLPIRGKIKNLLRASLDEGLENEEVRDIALTLGAGIQERYNAKRLRYGSVYMAVDGDADGQNIMCLLTVMFYVLMPKFIEEGRLKWLRAPLYRLTVGKTLYYAYSNEELAGLQKKYGRGNVTRYKGLGELSSMDLKNSMLGPNKRVEVLTYSDVDAANAQLEMLMGKDVSGRREFIMNNIDFEILED